MSALSDRQILISAGNAILKSHSACEAFGDSLEKQLARLASDDEITRAVSVVDTLATDHQDIASELLEAQKTIASLREKIVLFQNDKDQSAAAIVKLTDATQELEATFEAVQDEILALEYCCSSLRNDVVDAENLANDRFLKIDELSKQLLVVAAERDAQQATITELTARLAALDNPPVARPSPVSLFSTPMPEADVAITKAALEKSAPVALNTEWESIASGPGTKTERAWALHKAGANYDQIADILDTTRGSVDQFLRTMRRREEKTEISSQAPDAVSVATDGKPVEAARSGSRSSLEDGKENAGGPPANEPSESISGLQPGNAVVESASINVVIDFDEEEIEGPNGKSAMLGKVVLDMVDCLKSGSPRHLSEVATETGRPSKKVKELVHLYWGPLSKIGLEIIITGDHAQLHDITKD